VLKELVASGAPVRGAAGSLEERVQILADGFAGYLGGRQPTGKLFDDWVAECKPQI
jgi:hypothetical protein